MNKRIQVRVNPMKEDWSMEKVIRNGYVAVLYSPGARDIGWYSWNRKYPEILFDPNIVAMVEAGQHDQIEAYCNTAYPDLRLSGATQLEIEWIPLGTKFRITCDEYDGDESIEYDHDPDWLVA